MLTKKQKQIYDFIAKFVEKKDYSPSLEEIGGYFNLSISTIHEHVETLKSKGYLEKAKNRARSLEPRNLANQSLISVPLIGTIAAGQPIEAVQSPESIMVPKSQLSKSGEHFALRVLGNSMIDDGIFDGDVVLVKRQSTANNGETVVALLDGSEVTLKKIFREKNRFRLQPANPQIKPIYTKKLVVQGKVISVIRSLKNPIKQNVLHKKILDSDKTKSKNLQEYLNRVYLGDVMELLKKLPDNSIEMIFGDPDYNVGVKYGDKTYTKSFVEYIDWYIKLTQESMRVLKDTGNLFMLNYPKQNAHLRVKYLDNFYPLVHEYVWTYNTNVGHSPKRFTTAHRTILHIRKTENNNFFKDSVALPYRNPTDRRIKQNLKNGSAGRMPYSWFYYNLVKNVSQEKTYHACQIPQKLTEMLIKACTLPKNIVLVLFGGSGSELEVCKSLNRNYISAEIDKKYYDIIVDRLKNGYIQEKYKLPRNGKSDNKKTLPLFNKGG